MDPMRLMNDRKYGRPFLLLALFFLLSGGYLKLMALEKENLSRLYREIGESYQRLDKWSMYLITSYDKAENDIGRKADKNRKIYNGMLKTYYYQFLGPRPPKKKN